MGARAITHIHSTHHTHAHTPLDNQAVQQPQAELGSVLTSPERYLTEMCVAGQR